MLEDRGNLWDFYDQGHYCCITTNGTIKRKDTNELVMGAGCAGQAQDRFPGITEDWGSIVKEHGLHVYFDEARRLFMFPVKYEWYHKADLDLIIRSSKELTKLIQEHADLKDKKVFLPRPGCGLGKLDWETEVRPDIAQWLINEVTVITF